ncbi:MAK10-like protein [Tanacetum coccineum]
MQEYTASRAERIKRFEKAIFNQTDEINGRMAEMFRLLKELTSSTTPKKVLVREEIRNPITKNVNAISLCRIESEKAKENNEVIDKNITEHGKCNIEEPVRITNKEPLGEERKIIEPPEPQPVSHYLKHKINKELIEGLVENQRLTDERATKTDIRLSLASHSYIYPLGIVEDVLIEVAGYVYPMDFVILDVKENEHRPFILGTSFLTTAKAVIKFDKGIITLRLALEWEKRIKLHQKKEMEFDQWRSKIFNKRWPTPMKEEFEVRTEGGVEGW